MRVDEIALNEALTEQVLLREIFGEDCNSFWVRRKKEKILYDLKRIFILFPALKDMYDERFVIYSFIRLWYDGKIQKFNFGRCWRENIYLVLIKYGQYYDEHIKRKQESFVIQ